MDPAQDQEIRLDGFQKIDSIVFARCYQRCDAYWLVVVVDFMDPAQDQEIRLDGFQKIDSIVFERVLVYKTVFHHILTVTGPE